MFNLYESQFCHIIAIANVTGLNDAAAKTSARSKLTCKILFPIPWQTYCCTLSLHKWQALCPPLFIARCTNIQTPLFPCFCCGSSSTAEMHSPLYFLFCLRRACPLAAPCGRRNPEFSYNFITIENGISSKYIFWKISLTLYSTELYLFHLFNYCHINIW